MAKAGSWLTRTVLLLSVVSFLNDMAGELLYPVLPLYMASIGYGALWIGVLEGFAEAVSGLTKGWFGELSDRRGVRLPFVRAGYLLSALAKPALALIASVPWAILMRTSDRLGKGVRTGARDALLAAEVSPQQRGKAFGFHRALDTAGAVAGPLLAFAWLAYHPEGDYKKLFLYALFPGLACVLLLFLIRETKTPPRTSEKTVSPFSAFGYWKNASPSYRKLVTGIVLFTLFNSSDMFLLLLVANLFPEGTVIFGHAVNSAQLVVGIYIFYNIVYAFLSYPAGWLSDRFGPKRMLLAGYGCFALTYAGMAYAAYGGITSPEMILWLFLIYGVYASCTDGVSKSWISTVCGKSERGTALGLFAGYTSIAALTASSAAGVLWSFVSPAAVFILPAVVAVIASIYLTFAVKSPAKHELT